MEWTEEIVSRLKELWAQGLSTAEIGRQLNVTKNAVVGKAHRLGLEGRPSPIRKTAVKKEKAAVFKKEEVEEAKVIKAVKVADEKVKSKKTKSALSETKDKMSEKQPEEKVEIQTKKEVKSKKPKLDFSTPVDVSFKKRSNSECCWPIGDPGVKGFHFCGAQAIPGKPYCLEHVQVAYVKLRDRKNNVA